jgi:hypothetical protein
MLKGDEWATLKDPNVPERNYYFNRITRETTWVMPEHIRYRTFNSDFPDIEPQRLLELKQVRYSFCRHTNLCF